MDKLCRRCVCIIFFPVAKYKKFLFFPCKVFSSIFHQFRHQVCLSVWSGEKIFLDHIENKLKLNVIIAPHPKTKIKDRSSLFGYRKVIGDKTKDLIKNSSLVITRNSTAVSYACYYSFYIWM